MSKVKDKRLVRLGSRIREIRKAKGLSQEVFADQCNLDRTYIGGVERGERNISFLNLYIISSNLGLSLSELLINI
ncbi:helix-turn-helix transcriptional regulator [Spirulina major CS-329]|uniref:helix-turn-helix domain-containing protein n=1 Tax=Spirulina TaxID=1154 RepID=UPI00232C6E0B|nr:MULTISPECIES: helix-turn-helix transcriptional regulator [Spirulina]MDB9496072.1 helix-turn-helix transcriptional regulator [Spirulina subsalsa CS-330]MDB9503406.1 helix-turn-helix transcriptional regulator [Spirulina major CS-329]